MATVSRRLPQQPHLDVPKRKARELLNAWRASRPEALERISVSEGAPVEWGHGFPRNVPENADALRLLE